MDQYVITGGVPLVGETEISGMKNAALPILAASIMTDETVTLENLPDVDDVRVLSMNHNAIVSSLPDKNGKLYVRMGILRTQVSVDDIIPIGEDRSDGTRKGRQAGGTGFTPSFGKSASISPEINLIGKNVDEATAELDKYLDDALLAHLNSVRVIHGRGTGALKKGIHAWLRKQSYVKSFKQAEYDDGGEAVTVVTFK